LDSRAANAGLLFWRNLRKNYPGSSETEFSL